MSHHADRPSEPGPGHRPRPASDRARPASDHPRPPHRSYAPPGWRPPYPGPPVYPQRPGPPIVPVPAEPARGVLWAFVPFITFGYGTPFSFLYAAVRRGSWGLGATAAGYGAGTAAVMALLQSGDPVLTVLGSLMAILLWIAGTGHAFAVRTSVFPRDTPRNRLNEHAVEVAKYRRRLRDEARALAADDPALARELRIGRPDVPRTYDDGGLVDVNHAPREILEALPGMTPEMADRIIARRAETGSFLSAEEMAVDADIPPDALPQMADYTIFLR
ncbi:helix-hairpin-helix domain-containing protein [Actinomadura darangshiensis]|uniref:Helix-hairpin-helix domain-containing protein n=1 Tax=Actinomadura darangshiensis TaxID=705336 RepID=A0A4R5AXD3_9ACTN|nr:helix-hairpin-helix domain-containing protein [Actinomadura darangshiensis]TDD75332.1 helix-hairpin-helix domain-containing protein [Actinomadura darangshiensis]